MAQQAVRGTQDLLPHTYRQHLHMMEVIQRVADNYGYEPMATPFIEQRSVFVRTLGDGSDVVMKEMYHVVGGSASQEDEHRDMLALRPEGTAAVMRAFINHGQHLSLPVKWFYRGAMFRYERPQKGRWRQFHQAGVEALGSASPDMDVEVMACAWDVLRALDVGDVGVTLEVNTLGDDESKQRWRDALYAYFSRYEKELSPLSQQRLRRNPLRILDSKEKQDEKFKAEAPLVRAYLSPESQRFFHHVCEGLTHLGIPYRHHESLVRGLDYYRHTAFEIVTDHVGSHNALLAGGRYDGLAETLGGKKTPGIGWACGIERLALLSKTMYKKAPSVAVIASHEDYGREALALACFLRGHGVKVDYGFKPQLRKGLQRADKMSCCAACLLGEEEMKGRDVIVRNLRDGAQERVARDQLVTYLRATYPSSVWRGARTRTMS